MGDDDYGFWQGAARTTAVRVDAAVTAARAADAEIFTEAVADVLDLDGTQLAVLLGEMTRELVERLHPDGLDSDDAEQILTRTAAASAWYDRYSEESMILALLGALGVHDPDETRPADVPAVVAHGIILIDDLLAAAKAELPPVLDGVLRELMRAQTVELP